jgi:hypothetical protein
MTGKLFNDAVTTIEFMWYRLKNVASRLLSRETRNRSFSEVYFGTKHNKTLVDAVSI